MNCAIPVTISMHSEYASSTFRNCSFPPSSTSKANSLTVLLLPMHPSNSSKKSLSPASSYS